MATAKEVEELSLDDSSEQLSGSKSHTNLATYITTRYTKMYSVQDIMDFIDRSHGDVNLDQRNEQGNEQGQTALMRACFDRNKEVVGFLLDKGADPNLRCLKEGNTALHFVSHCHWSCDTDSETDLEDWEPALYKVPEAGSSCKDFLTEEKSSAKIIDILISQYGALIQVNKNGFTPADIAGLNRKLPTVLHYINRDYIPKAEQIRALEILGTTFMMKDDYEKAHTAFTMAMEKRCENTSAVQTSICRSELEHCLGRTECRGVNDLRKIKSDKYAMKVEAILVGDRVLPDSMKLEFVYERLADYGLRLSFIWDRLDAAFRVFTECLRLERKGLLPVGRVLMSLKDSISDQATSSPSLDRNDESISQYGNLLCHSLEAYVDVIRQVNIENLTSHFHDILVNLSSVLYFFTRHLCRVQGVHCALEPVVNMIKVIWSRLSRDSVSRDPYRSHSVCHNLLGTMVSFSRYDYPSVQYRYTFHFLKQVLVRLVQVEGAMDTKMNGDTLLHTLMGLVYSGELHMVLDMALLFMRYGCLSHSKNNKGKMPIDIAEEEAYGLEDCYLPNLTKVYSLLSPTVLTLQELTIRTILKYNIHYQDRLPMKFCSMVDELFHYDPLDFTREVRRSGGIYQGGEPVRSIRR